VHEQCARVQEEELAEREKAADGASRELHELRRAHAAAADEHARLQAAHDDLRAKLEDSKQQLKGNEQMIRWLNGQARGQ
jgi:chromosome segregation ATPase